MISSGVRCELYSGWRVERGAAVEDDASADVEGTAAG